MDHWIYELPYKAVVHTRKCVPKDVLMHYGVPGQKWGVITKEYEPVAVDHRKMRTSNVVRTSTTPRSAGSSLSRQQVREQKRRERQGYYTKENGKTVWRQNGKSYSPSEQRQKIVKRALIGTGIVAGLLITYGAVKYRQVQKAKAYSGILERFMHQNPAANLQTPEGRKLYQRGLALAKENSKNRVMVKNTNRYLKSRGLSLDRKSAMQTYRARKSLGTMASYKGSRNRALELIRRNRFRRAENRVIRIRGKIET